MPQPATRRLLGIILVALLGLGLVSFAVVHVIKWRTTKVPPKPSSMIKVIKPSEAPLSVQEAAAKLAGSRVAYAIPMGRVTYLIISTGDMGELLEVAGAQVMGSSVNIKVGNSSTGNRLLVARLDMTVNDTRMLALQMNGQEAGIPWLVNVDQLPLVNLPDKATMVLTSPVEGSRLTGTTIEVTGYARILPGQFSVKVFSNGKGRVLGDAKVTTAAGAPNWGSFKVSVSVAIPQTVTDGVVVLYDEARGTNLVVPVKFTAAK
jgi:hypothetical protein